MGGSRAIKRLHNEDTISGAELLELEAVRNKARTNAELSKKLKKRFRRQGFTPEQKTLYHELLYVDALAVQDRLIGLGFTTTDPQVMRVSHNAVQDVKDRVMGKPTERVQIASAVRVMVGGIDLSRLPDAPKDVDATLVDGPPKGDDRANDE